MLDPSSQTEFDDAVSAIQSQLASNPAEIKYMEKFTNHLEMFAAFKIDEVDGLLARRGSGFAAESNHSIVVAHLGDGDNMDLANQVAKLLERQEKQHVQWRANDFKYRSLCERKVRPSGTLEKDDTGRKEAILILSQQSHNSWEAEVTDSMNYVILRFDGTASCFAMASGEAPESTRRMDDGKDCSVKKKYSIGHLTTLYIFYHFVRTCPFRVM
jgi:hypothetical protein